VEAILLTIPRFSESALKNLEIAFPEKSPEERQHIFRCSKRVLARNVFFFARAPRMSREELARLFDYSALCAVMKEAKDDPSGVGVLGATMHLGCFELISYAFSALHEPVSVLVRPFGLPRLDAWWNSRRAQYGNRIFGRTGGYKEVVHRLNLGENVAILCDQNVKKNHAVFVDFFGKKAATTKTMALAALRTGARVVIIVSCEPVEGGPHKVYCPRLPNPRELPGTAEEQIVQFTSLMNAEMERIIREHPEQWFWIHRRWKTRPQDEPESLYD
jgi:KDO2-lipid IV(A) lauroyltransferase